MPKGKDHAVDQHGERVVVVELKPLRCRRLDAGQNHNSRNVRHVQHGDAGRNEPQFSKCGTGKGQNENCKECKLISQSTSYLEFLKDQEIEDQIIEDQT